MFPEMLPGGPPGQVPDMSLVLDYADHILRAPIRAAIGFVNLVAHVVQHPDDVVAAVSAAAHDALILSAAHMPPAAFIAPEAGDLMMMRQVVQLHPQIYREARARMEQRVAPIQHMPEMWDRATGPERAGMIAEVITGFYIPGWCLKGMRATQAIRPFGPYSRLPTYELPLPPTAANLNRVPAPIRELTVNQFRRAQADGMYHYVITERGRLLIVDRLENLTGNFVAAFVDHAHLARGERVIAAGELEGARGVVVSVNNRAIGAAQGADIARFDQVVRQIFNNHGFTESGCNFFRVGPGPAPLPPLPPGNNFYRILFPERLRPERLRLVGGTDVAARGAAPAASGALGGAEGLGVAAAANAIMGSAEAGVGEARILQRVANAAREAAEHAPPLPEVTLHNALEAAVHDPVNLPPPARMELPPPSPALQRAAVQATAAQVNSVVQQVMQTNILFAQRNRYLLASPPIPLPALFPTPATPSFSLNQPSFWDAERYLKSAMIYGSDSISSLQSRLRGYGFTISDSRIRSIVDSSSGVTRIGDHLVSHIGLTSITFANLLSTVGLTSIYNHLHDVTCNGLLRDFGTIGGVATQRGTIEGDIALHRDIKILVAGGKKPFSDDEMLRIIGELKKAIFDPAIRAFPFFSLHFNKEGHLFPVLHPYYQETLTGKVIAILDYFLKCFMNGVFYEEEEFILEEWLKNPNSDPAFLCSKIAKKRATDAPSLHELLFEAGFKNEAELCKKVRISFRILAKQNAPVQDKNVFTINYDFDVKFTIEPSPSFQKEIDSQEQSTEYLRLFDACDRYAKIIHEKMPQIPGVAKYFEMLGIISFISYYFDSLERINKEPIVPIPPPYAHFPRMLPPLPRRFYREILFSFNLPRLLASLQRRELDNYLYRTVMGEEVDGAQIKKATYHAMHSIIRQEIGSSDLDPQKVEELSDKYFFMMLHIGKNVAEDLLTQLLEGHNQRIKFFFGEKSERVEKLSCDPEVLAKQKNGRAKWNYLKRKREAVIKEIYKDPRGTRQQTKAVIGHWEEMFNKTKSHLKELSDTFTDAPITEKYRHEVIGFPTIQEAEGQVKIVGGCGMLFEPVTPIQATHNVELAESVQELSSEGFTEITHEGITYQGFSLASQKRVEEQEEEHKNEDERNLVSQGFSTLMIDGLQGDESRFSASLAKGGAAHRLESDVDLLRMLMQTKQEERALKVLKSHQLRDLDHVTEGDVTALHMALELQLFALAKKLIQMGADCTLPRYKDGYTALHVAAHYQQEEIISAMVQKGVDINLPLANGKTVLHLAAEGGADLPFIKFLISKGALESQEDDRGNIPLQSAIQAGEHEIALFLAKTAPVLHENTKGESIVAMAARYGMFPLMEQWIPRHMSRFSLQFDESTAHYIMKHGALQSFYLYQFKVSQDDPLLDRAIQAKSAGHGLMFYALLAQKNLAYDASQQEEFLTKLILLDETPAVVKLYKKGLNYPRYHCLAAEWGSRSVAKALQSDMHYDATTPLLSAIRGGDAEIFSIYWRQLEKASFIQKDTMIDPEGNRFVHEAVRYGRTKIVTMLYRFGHNIDLANNKGETPYMIADRHQDTEMKALLKRYGAVEKERGKEEPKPTAVGYECSKKDVTAMTDALREKNLAKWKRAINIKTYLWFDGEPLLHYLLQLDARSGEEFALQSMKELGFPRTKNRENEPVSFTLLFCKNEEEFGTKVGWLCRSYPHSYRQILSETDDKGQDLCDRAILAGDLFILRVMRDHNFSKQVFHHAAKGGSVEILQFLIEQHPDRSAAERFDDQMQTPMHLAASLGYTSIVQALLAWGVNPRLKNRAGELPLISAIKAKHKEVADVLIDELGDTLVEGDLADRAGRTPFMWAAIKDEPSLMARFPREKMYETDKRGKTALHLAASFGSLRAIKMLLAWGIDVNLGDRAFGKNKPEYGCTALHYAAREGQLETFRYLREKGAEMERVGSLGMTVAECMVDSKSEFMHHEMVQLNLFLHQEWQPKLLKRAAIIGQLPALEQLYVMGVPLDQYDSEGIPPLYHAVMNNHHRIVDFLLSKGCRVTQKMAKGDRRGIFDFAKDDEMKKLLESYREAQEIPAFPQSLPTWSSSRKATIGTPIPPHIKRGLSEQECAFIEKFPGEKVEDYYALAYRFKKEFGLEKFVTLFNRKLSGRNSSIEVMEVLHQFLTIKEAQGQLNSAWTFVTEAEMKAHLKSNYNRIMEERNNLRSPEEMSALFRATNEFVTQPLSEQEATKVAEEYRKVLAHRERLTHLTQEELGTLAKESQDSSEAIAAIRETLIRKKQIYPYDTQLFALLGLLGNAKVRLGQMQTGEGKSTVVAMLAAYYGTRGRKVDIITTTHSLAKRDQKKYQEFYRALGLTSSHIAMENPQDFSQDLIFGIQTDFEFALLRDKLDRKADVVIVDEVDGLLMDQGLNSAIISAPDEQDLSWLFPPYLDWIRTHEEFDKKEVRMLLSEINHEGTGQITDQKLKSFFYQGKRALERTENVDYVVKEGKIVIVDYENTGSLHERSRWSGGGHEFLEAKHRLKVEKSTVATASISHSAFFARYLTFRGLSGTLGDQGEEREELEEIYGAKLFDIPTHFPSQRTNRGVSLIDNDEEYYQKIVDSVRKKNRPVLVLVQTIEESLKLSKRLKRLRIQHRCLNAIQQEGEDYLLEKAVAKRGVTIATSVAARGTDFVLPPESQKAGGLHVILGFLPYNMRVEKQCKGRTSRQGQKGSYEMIIHTKSPFVQQLLTMHPPRNKVRIEDLLRYRSMRVKLFSMRRREQAQLSLIHYSLFKDFSRIRRSIISRLEGPSIAEWRETLTKLWSEFFNEIEPLSLPAHTYEQLYERFIESKVKALFTGSWTYLREHVVSGLNEERKE